MVASVRNRLGKLTAAVAIFLMIASPVYAMKIKEFKNGQWVECDTANPGGCEASGGPKEIPLTKRGNVYELPVRVNGVMTLNFVLDTGASEVYIPANVASALLKTGTITQSDYLPGGISVFADGSQRESSRVIIQEMDLGGLKVSQVPAIIGPPTGYLLLGQSFLNRLESWSLDNKKNVLVVGR